MSDETRCAVCNRHTPTAEEWETVKGGERADLCWGGRACDDEGRALLRAEVERLRAERDALRAAVREYLAEVDNAAGVAQHEELASVASVAVGEAPEALRAAAEAGL